MTDDITPVVPHSQFEGIFWPAVPAAQGRLLLAGLQQIGQSQWWPPEQLERSQLAQLRLVLDHALEHVPFYREDWGVRRADLPRELTMEAWRSLPIVTRRMVQQSGRRMVIDKAMPEHGGVTRVVTSGSTGRPVEGFGNQVTQFMWSLLTLRDHEWHRRDFSGRLAVMRMDHESPASYPAGMKYDDWGVPVSLVYPSGPAAKLDVREIVSHQVEWLSRFEPHYVLTYPSNIAAIAQYCLRHNIRMPNLHQVRTLGEVVTPQARRICREAFGVPLTDVYSAQEVGYMALQCPDHEHYHVQSEAVLLEVVDDAGKPCKPGEIGRVLVSALHNFVMPLLRYEVGDWAMVGEPCTCGRGLPVLTRIMGRQRNMMVLPGGEQRFVIMDENIVHEPKFAPVLRIEQFQVIQRTREEVELVLVVHPRLTADEEGAVTEYMARSFGHAFRFVFTYVDEIPRSASGKFEDFRCEVSADDSDRMKEHVP